MSDAGAILVDRLLNGDCLRALALRGDEAVLDVGCGYGEFTRLLAAHARTVVGVDRDAAALAAARGAGAGAEFRAGDAAALPLRPGEWGTFDVVHARFLLESLADPAPAVGQMVRAARPGGRVVLVDDDHATLCLWPELPAVRAAWDAYQRAFDAAGGDALVGRKLVALLDAAGATPVRASSLSFGACAGEPHFAAMVARLHAILADWRDALLAAGRLAAAAHAAALAELREWGRRPDATAWYVVRMAEGRRPTTTS